MQHKIRAALAAAAVAAISLGLAVAASGPASAAPTVASFQTPVKGGLLLNALHWGGTGSKAATLANGGVVNDPISVWAPSSASVASDFAIIPVTFLTADKGPAATTCGTSCFLLEYAPGSHLSGLCVSTVTNVKGAFARLRVCAHASQSDTPDGVTTFNTNQWQDFALTGMADGLSQLQAVLEPTPGPFVLNDAQFGGNGSQVISWTSFVSENQLWEQVPAS